MRLWRTLALSVALAGVTAACAGSSQGEPTPAAGPLGVSWPRIGQGHYLVEGDLVTDNLTWGTLNDSGSPIVLQGVSLRDPSPGLKLIGAVFITETPNEIEPHAAGFPSPSGLPSVTLAGHTVPAGGPINLSLGLRIDDPKAVNGFDGVFVDYTVDGRSYRTTIPYRSILCPGEPVEGKPCHVPSPDSTWTPSWVPSSSG